MIDQRRQFLRAGLGLSAGTALPLFTGCAGTAPADAERRTPAAARGAGPVAPPRDLAAAPPAPPATATAPAPAQRLVDGVYRTRIGDIELTAISDGFAEMPLHEGYVRNASMAQVRQALRDAGLPADRVTIPFTAFLALVDGRRILFDAGNGQFGAPTSGRLLENLRAARVAPDSIDMIVISHFHGDHINGLRGRDGRLTFPNARIHVPAPEWDFWMDDARMNAAPEALQDGFRAVRRVFAPIAGQVERFEPGVELMPGLRTMPAFGHTPGHTAYVLYSGERTWAFVGDLTNVAALFVRNPDWAVSFDMDAETARQTRRRIFDMAIANDWIVSGYHLPFPAVGKVSRRDRGYDFAPAMP